MSSIPIILHYSTKEFYFFPAKICILMGKSILHNFVNFFLPFSMSNNPGKMYKWYGCNTFFQLKLEEPKLKELSLVSNPIFWGLFWPACMDRSGREQEPLLVFNFFCFSLSFGCHFIVLKHLFPKHPGDSWNLQDGFTNVSSGSRRFPISFS